MNPRPPARSRTAFTLIELLVVIAIIAILAAILFPVFAKARDAARKASSLSNVNQILKAQLMYAQDYDETFCPTIWENPRSDAADGIDYDCSWMLLLQPYVKNLRVFYSPNATNQDDPVLVGPGRRSNGILFSYAMLPRWKTYSGEDPGPGNTWPTAFGNALYEGIGGYSSNNGTGYIGDSDYCGQGVDAQAREAPSLSHAQVARPAETALVVEARGWEYGMMCFNVYPSPADAMPPVIGSAFEGLNFAGRFAFVGTQTYPSSGPVKYLIGHGPVGFADGHVKAMRTEQFFETITLKDGQRAYRYQYALE